MSLTPHFIGLFHTPEMEAFRHTLSDTGRLQALIYAIFTIIAFYHLTRHRIPLGCSPGAGRDAGFAPHTKIGVDKNNSILGALLHGTCRAGGNAPRLFTVKTGDEHIGHPRHAVYPFGPYGNNLAEPRPNG